MSLTDIYNDVCITLKKDKPRFLQTLETHIDFEKLIPNEFYWAFNRNLGRNRDYQLVGFLKFFVIENVIGVPNDNTMLNILNLSIELKEYCEFDKISDLSKITRFKQDFSYYIKMVFDKLVELTEPICRVLDSKKSDYLMYDTTGILANVAENNPKYLNTKLNNCKKLVKNNSNINERTLRILLP